MDSSLRGPLATRAVTHGRGSAVRFVIATAMLLGMQTYASLADAVAPRRLVEIVDIGRPVISPDGSLVAFRTEQASIERNTYDTIWYVQRMDGASPPLKVADGGIPLRNSAGGVVAVAATWSPDGAWIYYRAMLDERIDVWRAAVDGSSAEPLTLDRGDVRDFSLSDDGRVLRYSVGASREDVLAAELAEYDHGIRIDEKVPVGQGLFRSTNLEGRLATQRYTGNWFDRDFLLADTAVRWRAVDLEKRTVRDIDPVDTPAVSLGLSSLTDGPEPPWRWTHDPATGRVALLTRSGDDHGLAQKPSVRLSMLPSPSARHPIECVAEPCKDQAISALQWRPRSDDVLFTVTNPDEGQAQAIFRWNVRTSDVHLIARSAGLLSGGRDTYSDCGVSSMALACVTSDANTPPRLERIDLETGDRTVLFSPNDALAWELEQATPARLLRWKDAEGRQFTGQFISATHRRSDGAPPLFVTYYSCPGFLRGGVGDEWPLALLARRGIAALCINRYHEFPLDAVKRYDIARSGIASAIDALAAAGEIDRRRVGMGGLSFGSEVTLWTAIHSNLLAAASISTPVVSPTYYAMGSLKGESPRDS